MTENKRTVEQYINGFRSSDHERILACLAENVEWIIPGHFHVHGKDAFDAEIENDAFVGSPAIEVKRLVEEADVVVAEGRVRSRRTTGGELVADFCDVFEMEDGKVRRLTSYVSVLEPMAG